MDAITNFLGCRRPLIHRLDFNRSFFSKPVSSLSFRAPPSPSRKFAITVKASSKPKLSNQDLKPLPLHLLKTTVLAAASAILSTAVLFARVNLKHAVAVPIMPPPPPASEEKLSEEDASLQEREKTLEAYADQNPDDVQALKDLLEAKVKNRKISEGIVIVERLMKLEPEEEEWPLLKAHMHFNNDEAEIALKGFNEIASKDPLRSEAYHGLVMVASQLESEKELMSVEERIEDAIEICERDEKQNEARNLKLLIAQIRVIEGDYPAALKVYKDLVNEEPKDFRPYLCQGIIYTLLKKKAEAEEQFQNYKKYLPEEHPYGEYFDENMMATKLFAQKVENEERSSIPGR